MPTINLDSRFFPPELQAKAAEHMPRAAAAMTALRNKSCAGAEWTGWLDWPNREGFSLGKDVKRVVENLDLFYDLVLVIGIGGSYLGARAVADALSHEYLGLLGKNAGAAGAKHVQVVYAGQHLSESGLLEILDLLETRQPVVNIVSKTGTTTEPAIAFRVIRNYMEKRFGKGESARRIIVTTDRKKGALRRQVQELGYRSFEVPDAVGGRYSVLTAVGLVPLALAGFNIENLLAGADSVFKDMRTANLEASPVLQYAASRMAAYDAGKRIELLSYGEPKLRNVAEWWKQLFGESEGKQGRGLFPASLTYTTDLHSLGQYVQDGCRNLLETFLIVEQPHAGPGGIERLLKIPHSDDNADELGYLEGRLISEINTAAMQGTKVAHVDGGVACLQLSMPRLDEFSLGSLFAFFETACAVSGALLEVNPFDQPGVEAYKKNLFGLLGKPGFEDIGAALRKRI